jgi:hypothetical protein
LALDESSLGLGSFFLSARLRFNPTLFNVIIVRSSSDPVMYHSCDAIMWNNPPLSICANPKFRMNLVFWNNFAAKNAACKKIIVHGLCYDPGHCRRGELDKGVGF